VKPPVTTATAYEQAVKEVTNNWIQSIATLVIVLVTLIPLLILPSDVVKTRTGNSPNEWFAGFLALDAILLTLLAVQLAHSSARIAMLQMRQAEEHRSADRATDLGLAEAMSEIAKELRRRPEVSSSVTFALFAAPGNRGNAESPIDGRGPGSV
jgi:hypothetical protein